VSAGVPVAGLSRTVGKTRRRKCFVVPIPREAGTTVPCLPNIYTQLDVEGSPKHAL